VTIEKFIEQLAEQGVRIRVEEGDVIWNIPWGFKDGRALSTAIRERKAELLAFFAAQDAPGASPDAPPAAAGVSGHSEGESPQDYDERAAEEQAYGTIAAAMPDGELLEWIRDRWGATFSLDAKGRLKAAAAGALPEPVRTEIRSRQKFIESRLRNAAVDIPT
jgi:hypothetical protein